MLGVGTVLGSERRNVQVAVVQNEEGTPSGGSVVLGITVMELQYTYSGIYLFIVITFT
jgi:hypothetical protein